MGLVVTTNARIVCAHGGQVTLSPRQATVTIDGGAVLREGDLVGAPIVGCAQPPPGSSQPSTAVVSTQPGGSSPPVSARGLPVHLDSLSGMTDGVPPGVISVVFAGQTTVQA